MTELFPQSSRVLMTELGAGRLPATDGVIVF
jgi:hypothetical protein